MIKSQQEVQDMLDKFDNVDQEGGLDCDGESILNALSWVLGHHDDSELTQHLPED